MYFAKIETSSVAMKQHNEALRAFAKQRLAAFAAYRKENKRKKAA
jgi:hypothetical protein